MPPFAALATSSKRKSENEHDVQVFKRSAGERAFWMVQFRAPQQKKHKTWDGDGVLVVKGAFFDLLDGEDGRR